MKCRLIKSDNYNPFWNMAFDYYFWKKCQDKKKPPVLRFYKWNPCSVSIGYNQNPDKIVNIEFCKKESIPIVKRPTGGSAIFHDIEITYSFCSNINHHPSFFSPFFSYIKICKSIIKGIENLGIKMEIRGFSENKEPSFTNIPCFSLSSRHDIVYNGKKIVGSAQRRNNLSFLQHGSILIDIRKDLWINIFYEKVNFDKIGYLKELIGNISEEKVINLIKGAFEETLEINIIEDIIEKKEENEIIKIENKLKREGIYE
ncbi:MAG: lipoate--protein ligase family protein [Candidatus Omnitrophica bacterium]|nr:lipoate--protein ligase family protein [Candidatus Omnitrophota bacterium]